MSIFKIILFMYYRLCWVSTAVQGFQTASAPGPLGRHRQGRSGRGRRRRRATGRVGPSESAAPCGPARAWILAFRSPPLPPPPSSPAPLLSSCSAWASHCGGFSYGKAWALGAQAQKLWRTGLAARRQVESSQTRESNPCLLHCKVDPLPLDRRKVPPLSSS